jgi:hypothetical protein
VITDAFEGFAHALRILPEVVYRAYELVRVDAHEAAGNIEHALTSVLNAFHSVYDSARVRGRIVGFHSTGTVCLKRLPS